MTWATSDLKAALSRTQQLIRVAPAAGAHRVAVRAGISIALPLAVLWLTGHIAWSMYATFGAFASLYGRDAAYGARLRMQLQAGAVLVLGVTAGTATACLADRRWLAVPVVAACAFLGSLLADRLRWHPAGPLFVVFGAAALADAIEQAWRGGAEHRLVVLTGGEPLLQVDRPLVAALHARRFGVALETNGTIAVPDGVDWICVSPKADAPLAQTHGQELKLVYPQPGVDPARFEGLAFERFLLQPMDGPERAANTQAAIAYCLAHPRWRLSVQTHKYLGIA